MRRFDLIVTGSVMPICIFKAGEYYDYVCVLCFFFLGLRACTADSPCQRRVLWLHCIAWSDTDAKSVFPKSPPIQKGPSWCYFCSRKVDWMIS
jgi:hypothetical protein